MILTIEHGQTPPLRGFNRSSRGFKKEHQPVTPLTPRRASCRTRTQREGLGGGADLRDFGEGHAGDPRRRHGALAPVARLGQHGPIHLCPIPPHIAAGPCGRS